MMEFIFYGRGFERGLQGKIQQALNLRFPVDGKYSHKCTRTSRIAFKLRFDLENKRHSLVQQCYLNFSVAVVFGDSGWVEHVRGRMDLLVQECAAGGLIMFKVQSLFLGNVIKHNPASSNTTYHVLRPPGHFSTPSSSTYLELEIQDNNKSNIPSRWHAPTYKTGPPNSAPSSSKHRATTPTRNSPTSASLS